MLDWTHWAGLLAVIFILWLLIRVFLKGPALRAYDSLPARCTRVREQASPEHQQTLLLLAEASVEIRAAPRKRRVAAIRQFMARGFVKPLLLTGDSGYRVLAVDAGGVPGEWVLAPNADPNRRLLYLHGGNFLSGCPQGHRVITTELARVTGAVVLALDYRLMPEHLRRDLIADSQAGYRWILDHGPDGPAPVRELFVAGDSAGGNLALMVIAWARDVGLPAATGAIALSPGLDMTLSSPTVKGNLKTDLMLGPSLSGFLKVPVSIRLLLIWAITRMRPPNPLVSPIFGDLSGLPPVLIQASEAEMLLGDARRYVNKASAAGSPAELETWPELLHVWHLFGPTLPEAGEAFERIGQFVKRCTGGH
jgi:acetyl esterase/lipase